ncbi:MAG: CotH kinase family protein [Deltaproteobacteria bacterium]|nr:CotH kinase family protein [Deltaproteobacteria bacterium]
MRPISSLRPLALTACGLLAACAPSIHKAEQGGEGGADGTTDGTTDSGADDGATDGADGGLDGADGASPPPPPVKINELMAKNQSVVQEADGRFLDWVELVNLGDAALPLDGWRLVDDGEGAALPAGLVLAPGGHLRLRLDEEGGGDLPLALSAGGGALQLIDDSGALVDALAWPALGADLSFGRFPDGAAFVSETIQVTPGAANPADPGLERDPSVALFPQDRVLQVEVELSEDAVARLASEPTRDVPGALTVDGVRLGRVGVRIKGQIGSYRPLEEKAALRMNLDLYVDGQRLRGMETFTLNNMVQDPSYVHEVLVYRLLREAGVPAPRTAWAQLSVNGVTKGIYLHVESVDDQFLERWYADPTGDMWEGEYGTDLTWGSFEWLDLDELGADGVDDREELARLADILALPPAEEHAAALEALIDVDAWAKAMAAEVVVGHWDGYFYYPNNYRVYHEPTAGLLHLIPWGVDQTLDWSGDLHAPNGAVARWMLEVPSLRRRYDLALWEMSQRMVELPADDELARANTLVRPLLRSDPYALSPEDWDGWTDASRRYLRRRSEEIRAALFPEGEP